MSTATHVELSRHGVRADIIFRTESGLNVASTEFLSALEPLLDSLASDTAVRFVVFRGEGKAFLAGANIKAMSQYDAAAARSMAQAGHRVFNKIEALPQVTVAALQGVALGGGCEFALACDFRFAVKSINIGQPEVLLGLIPGWGGTQRLPQLIGAGRARRLILSGQHIKAEAALDIGLVDEIVNSAEDLEPLVAAFLRKLQVAGPSAIAQAKQALRGGNEIDAFVACFDQGQAAAGMTAFLAKRPPPWNPS